MLQMLSFFNKPVKIAIDASRNRSGGAIAHVVGILSSLSAIKTQGLEIHLWANSVLHEKIQDQPWIIKHNPSSLSKSLPVQIIWQAFFLKRALKKEKCDILFTTDASTFCRFKPMVVLSQDMLSYEPSVITNFSGLAYFRLISILFLQNSAFRSANGVVFLTKYAGDVIQKSCGSLKNITHIPHGVDDKFRVCQKKMHFVSNSDREISCLYVSPVWEFKHQWVVVKAIKILRDKGHNLLLDLVGGGNHKSLKMLHNQMKLSDPDQKFVTYYSEVKHSELPVRMCDADLSIFASSCENLPITLLESMATGLPIACSNRGPMPEVLGDAGVYFDPENAVSIANAIEQILSEPDFRSSIAEKAKKRSESYTWNKCADETFSFIMSTYFDYKESS